MLITDWNMPALNGYQLLEKIRGARRRQQLPHQKRMTAPGWALCAVPWGPWPLAPSPIPGPRAPGPGPQALGPGPSPQAQIRFL